MDYEIKGVSDTKQLKDFIALPYIIYKDDPNWVPPIESELRRLLSPEKNPYFSETTLQLFNCYKTGEMCSRVAIIINKRHQQKYGEKTAFFGFFESINDPTAVAYLFEKIEQYCIFNGIESLEGPFNPNHYSELGLKADQFDSLPTFFQTYNPSFYKNLLENVGFYISKNLHIRVNNSIQQYLSEHYPEVHEVQDNGYSVRSFRKNQFDMDLEHLRDVFNDAFSQNWHFLPVSHSEYRFCARYLNLVSYPELIQFVEHNGKPVAAIQFVLDINPHLQKFVGKLNVLRYLQFLTQKKKIRKIIIYAVGVKKAYRRTQAFPLVLQATIRVARKYDVLETTWTSDDNEPAIRAANLLGLKPDKQFFIYAKKVRSKNETDSASEMLGSFSRFKWRINDS